MHPDWIATEAQRTQSVEAKLCGGTPPPGCFAKRGCKLMKTKEVSAEKRAKRNQEAAS